MEPKTRQPAFSLLLILCILCAALAAQAASSDSRDADRLFAFAGSLMQEQDYYRAITEYKRFLSYYPDDERSQLCLLNIGMAYGKGGKTDLAVEQFQKISDNYPGTPTAERAGYEIGLAYYADQRYEDADKAFSDFIKNYPGSIRMDPAHIYLGWSLIHLWKTDRAAMAFSAVSKESPQYPLCQAISGEMESGPAHPSKSPVLAGIFSAVIPGSGQIYTGRLTEGVTSFVLNGSFIWAIVELFDRGSEAAGFILGFLETGWYTGGIFGAVNDAHKFNRRAREDFIENLQNRYPMTGVKQGMGP